MRRNRRSGGPLPAVVARTGAKPGKATAKIESERLEIYVHVHSRSRYAPGDRTRSTNRRGLHLRSGTGRQASILRFPIGSRQ